MILKSYAWFVTHFTFVVSRNKIVSYTKTNENYKCTNLTNIHSILNKVSDINLILTRYTVFADEIEYHMNFNPKSIDYNICVGGKSRKLSPSLSRLLTHSSSSPFIRSPFILFVFKFLYRGWYTVRRRLYTLDVFITPFSHIKFEISGIINISTWLTMRYVSHKRLNVSLTPMQYVRCASALMIYCCFLKCFKTYMGTIF